MLHAEQPRQLRGFAVWKVLLVVVCWEGVWWMGFRFLLRVYVPMPVI